MLISREAIGALEQDAVERKWVDDAEVQRTGIAVSPEYLSLLRTARMAHDLCAAIQPTLREHVPDPNYPCSQCDALATFRARWPGVLEG